jgi:hypothetical protein
MGHRKINLSIIFAGQVVGVREVADKIWLVSFMDFDLGFFDEDCGRVEPAPNPFWLFIINGGHRGSLDCFCGNGLRRTPDVPRRINTRPS